MPVESDVKVNNATVSELLKRLEKRSSLITDENQSDAIQLPEGLRLNALSVETLYSLLNRFFRLHLPPERDWRVMRKCLEKGLVIARQRGQWEAWLSSLSLKQIEDWVAEIFLASAQLNAQSVHSNALDAWLTLVLILEEGQVFQPEAILSQDLALLEAQHQGGLHGHYFKPSADREMLSTLLAFEGYRNDFMKLPLDIGLGYWLCRKMTRPWPWTAMLKSFPAELGLAFPFVARLNCLALFLEQAQENLPQIHFSQATREIGIIISPDTGDSVKAALDLWLEEVSGVTLTYILQAAPSGLAHAVKIAQDFLQDSPFVMYLGDNLVEDKLSPLITAFFESGADAHILLKTVDNPEAFGVAQVDQAGKVIALIEKPKNPPSSLALVGVYLFQPSIFTAIDAIQPSPRGELEITDAIQELISSGKHVESSVMQGWWLDTGKKDDLLAANKIVLDSYCKQTLSGEVIDCSITGAVEIAKGSTIKNSTLIGPLRIASDCIIENAHIGPYSSIGKDCEIKDMALSDSVILQKCSLSGLEGRLTHSLIGQGCKIEFDTHKKPSEYQLTLGDDNTWIST